MFDYSFKMGEIVENTDDLAFIVRVKAGDIEAWDALLCRYDSCINIHAKRYGNKGVTYDDLLYAGRIGLFKAATAYNYDKAKFTTFAELCVRRQMASAVRSANNRKNKPMNFHEQLDDKMVENPRRQPEIAYIEKESLLSLTEKIRSVLTPLERTALNLRTEGRSYLEIAKTLDSTEKTVDNAITRAKKKIGKLLDINT